MLELREATPAEVALWDDIVGAFPNHRVTHTHGWIDSLVDAALGRPLWLVWRRDERIVAAMPGLVARIGPLRLYGSPLPGWQTSSMGPAYDPAAVTTGELVAPLTPFLARRGIHHAEIMSNGLEPEPLAAAGWRGSVVPTYRVPLYPGDEARAFRNLTRTGRANIRRARELGLQVRIENDPAFVAEHLDQVREVYRRRATALPFGERRVRGYFDRLGAAGHRVAVAVYLPDGRTCIASALFTIEGRELLLWTWAHRDAHRWYRGTEILTWTVMQRAMAAGCDTLDLMGLGIFKLKFGATRDDTKHRWIWDRYSWLATARRMAETGYHWQQSVRGRLARRHAAAPDEKKEEE